MPTSVGALNYAGATTINCKATGRFLQVRRTYLAGDDNILHICELRVWASNLRDEPLARHGHAAASFRGQMMVFGGQDGNGVRLADLRMFDTLTRSWVPADETITLGTSPRSRSYTGMMVVDSNRLFLTSGATELDPLNDAWFLTFPTCPALVRDGIASESCFLGGTVCFYTCTGGFGAPNGANPVVCDVDGTWRGVTPVCGPPVAGSSNTPIASVSALLPQQATVSWVAPAYTGYYSTILGYYIRSVDDAFVEDFILSNGARVDSARSSRRFSNPCWTPAPPMAAATRSLKTSTASPLPITGLSWAASFSAARLPGSRPSRKP